MMKTLLTTLALLLSSQIYAQEFVEGTATNTGPETDEEICQSLIQRFYLEQDDETGTSLVRENDSCSCQLSGDHFLLECRLSYCPECNSAGVCGVWIFRNRYQASLLQQKEQERDAFNDLALLDQALVDFSQCIEYVQGRDETICTTTSADGQTCTLDLNGSPCSSCHWDDTICYDPSTEFSGGFVFDCQNVDGGMVFNSCNQVSDTTQAVALDSAFAYFDDKSLQFVSCYDASVEVATPPPAALVEESGAAPPLVGSDLGPALSSEYTNDKSSANSRRQSVEILATLLGSALVMI